MSRLCSCGVALFLLAMLAVMAGCGSSSPPISVSLSPSLSTGNRSEPDGRSHGNGDE